MYIFGARLDVRIQEWMGCPYDLDNLSPFCLPDMCSLRVSKKGTSRYRLGQLVGVPKREKVTGIRI